MLFCNFSNSAMHSVKIEKEIFPLVFASTLTIDKAIARKKYFGKDLRSRTFFFILVLFSICFLPIERKKIPLKINVVKGK